MIKSLKFCNALLATGLKEAFKKSSDQAKSFNAKNEEII